MTWIAVLREDSLSTYLDQRQAMALVEGLPQRMHEGMAVTQFHFEVTHGVSGLHKRGVC